MHTIQQLAPGDIAEVIELWRSSGPGVTLQEWETPELMLRAIEHFEDLSFVAIEDGRIVGAVMGGYVGLRGLVQHLAVHKQYQHRGIGASLMQACCEAFKRRGIRRVLLGVGTEEGVSFYRSVGFTTNEGSKMMWRDI